MPPVVFDPRVPVLRSEVTVGWVPGTHDTVLDVRDRDVLPVYWKDFDSATDMYGYYYSVWSAPEEASALGAGSPGAVPPAMGAGLGGLATAQPPNDPVWVYAGVTPRVWVPLADVAAVWGLGLTKPLAVAVFGVTNAGVKSKWVVSQSFLVVTSSPASAHSSAAGTLVVGLALNQAVLPDGRPMDLGPFANGVSQDAAVVVSPGADSRAYTASPVLITTRAVVTVEATLGDPTFVGVTCAWTMGFSAELGRVVRGALGRGGGGGRRDRLPSADPSLHSRTVDPGLPPYPPHPFPGLRAHASLSPH
jgi:hypothetical protein